MKNKKKSNVDPIAKVRKDKNFSLYTKEVTELIKIKIAMYKARKKKGWSQTMLAKEMYTTEEIIDNIENSNGLNL